MVEDVYEIGAIDPSSYMPESKGVKYAKRMLLWSNIILWYGLWSVLIFLLWTSRTYYDYQIRYCTKYGFINLSLAIVFGVVGIWFCFRACMKLKLKELPLEEKFHYDLYIYHKKYYKRKFLRNEILLALAKLNVQMNDKELCQKAVEKMSEDYTPSVLEKIKGWAYSDEEIDVSSLERKGKINPIKSLIAYWLIAFSFAFNSVEYPINFYYKVRDNKTIYGLMGVMCILGTSLFVMMIYTYLITSLNYRTEKDVVPMTKPQKILALVIAIITVLTVKSSKQEIFDFIFDNGKKQEAVVTTDDSYWYTDSYDYSYEENEEDEEEYTVTQEIDVMNMMIVLCNYLQKEGTIPDFTVELDYNAKGRVKGTVAQDDEFIYVLYDNDIKQDEEGNDCLELVLEAEPLDKNGNSLGQTEAKLRGFYLVNLDTKEVIDEHKTHW